MRTGEEGEMIREGNKEGGGANGRGCDVMCLRSFSISTEVLFIRLKSIIYAAAAKKTIGKY